jgi:1,4-dihydroxy-2-naphthoate octaprenyltransferase
VLLGVGTAVWTQGAVNGWHVFLVFVGAVTAHISVNALNEYFDFRSGLDLRTQRTPFSGGSGTLPANPAMANKAAITGMVTLAIAIVVGAYFLTLWGWGLFPLGVLGLVIIAAYTAFITHLPLACLLAPGIGFGLLMIMGTHFALTGSYSWTAFVASLVPTFLVSDLLLLNQFPDVEADASVGRRHYPIVLGRKRSSLIYGAFLLLAYVTIVAGVAAGVLPALSLLGLLTLALAIPCAVGAYRHAEDLAKLVPYMGMNVLLTVLTPILVAVGLLVG